MINSTDYNDYCNTLSYLASLEKWRVELFFYQPSPATLAPSDMVTANASLESIKNIKLSKQKKLNDSDLELRL